MKIDMRYMVCHGEYGRWIMGDWMNTKDSSALLKTWAYDGYDKQSREVALALGAMVAVVKTFADADEWLISLGKKNPPDQA